MRTKKSKPKFQNTVLLKRADSPYELGIIKALLKENEIPYIVDESGSDQYMRISTGRALTGSNILIPESALEKAKELLETIGITEEASE